MIRTSKKTDAEWIVDSWVKSWRNRMSDWEQGHVDFELCVKVIRTVLSRPGVVIRVDEDNTTERCRGWIAAEPDDATVWYAYTVHACRGSGVFSRLLVDVMGGDEGVTLAGLAPKGLRARIQDRGGRSAPTMPWIVYAGSRA